MRDLMSFIARDRKKCTACKTCELACHAGHMSNGATTGTIEEAILPRLIIKHHKDMDSSVECHHCEAAPCAQVCPEGAIYHSHGALLIDSTKCREACNECVKACIYQVLIDREIEPLGIRKCDLCKERVGGPACIEVCPEKALRLVKPRTEKVQKARSAALAWHEFTYK